MSVGKNIKNERTKKGYSQRKLGEISGVSHTQIAKYETDKAIPTDKTLKRIANALEIPHYLLYGEKTILDNYNSQKDFLNKIDDSWEEFAKERLSQGYTKEEVEEEIDVKKAMLKFISENLETFPAEYYINSVIKIMKRLNLNGLKKVCDFCEVISIVKEYQNEKEWEFTYEHEQNQDK